MTSRASVTIYTDADRERVARWAKDTGAGTVVEFRKKSRSTEQNAKLWAMLSEVSEQVEWYGQKLDAEDWKDMFTASLRHARVVPGIDKGTYVPLGMRTSNMTIDEMGNLIELIYAFGAQQEPPVVFKDPQPESGASPSAPADDEARPSALSSTEDAIDPAPKQPVAASSTLSKFNFADGELVHLKDFARKALKQASAPDLSVPAKMFDLEGMEQGYRGEAITSDDGLGALDAMIIAINAVVNGKRTKEQSAAYIARELLDCDVKELEGRSNG